MYWWWIKCYWYVFTLLEDKEVTCVGIEAGGLGLDTDKHGCSLEKGTPGVLHGQCSYLLQDEDGRVLEAHSISAGLDYPELDQNTHFIKIIKV